MKSFKSINTAINAVEHGTTEGIIRADDVITLDSIRARARHFYLKFGIGYQFAELSDIEQSMYLAYYEVLNADGIVSQVSFYTLVNRELACYRNTQAKQREADYRYPRTVKQVIVQDYEGALVQYLEHAINERYKELIRAHHAKSLHYSRIPEDLKKFELLKETERAGLFSAGSIYEPEVLEFAF